MYRAKSARAERRRLILTYTLVPIFIVGVVTLLVFYMLGYRFSLTDHSVSQGGLVQFDSRPSGATITFDTKQLPSRTATRYDAPAGLHTVTMQLAGYLPWQKTVTVEPGKILWLNYARLIPESIKHTNLLEYEHVTSSVASFSKQQMVIIPDAASPKLDIVKLDASVTRRVIELPTSLYEKSNKTSFRIVKLSLSGRFAIVKHDFDSQHEWLLVDIEDTSKSLNITRLIGSQTAEPIFVAQNERQLYATVGSTLRLINAEAQTMSAPLVSNVAEISQSADGVVAYVTLTTGQPKQREVGYFTPGAAKPHVIRTFYDTGQAVLRVRTAEYAGKHYVALQYGTTIEISSTHLSPSDSNQELQLASVATLAVPDGADVVEFSPSERFVITQRASTYLTYDLELNSLSTTSLRGESPVKRPVEWLDNYILWSDRDSILRTYEFDGANAHTIGAVSPDQAIALSRDGKYIYAFQATDSSVNLIRFHLRIDS